MQNPSTLDAPSQLFGLIIPGRQVITDFTKADPSGTKYTLTIPFPVSDTTKAIDQLTTISDVVFFTLPNITIPANNGVMIYWSAQSSLETAPSSSFELLGALTPSLTSTILRTGWSTNEPLRNLIASTSSQPNPYISITFGVSIESLDNVSNLQSVLDKGINERKNIAHKIALDLFNYLQSFDDTQHNGSGWMNVPTNVFERWIKRFEMKMGRDPNFFMKSSKE
jgi:hypothetical protein